MHVIEWLRAHGPELLAFVYAAINVANALVRSPEAKTKLGKVADLVSVLARKDAEGTLKKPFTRSRARKRSADKWNDTKSKKGLKALALLAAASLTLSACASWQNNLRQSVAAAAELGTTTADMVAALDEARLQEVAASLWKDHNVPAAEAARDAWLDKYHKASQALHVYAAAVSAAKLASEMAIAGKQQDVGRILRDLLVAARALKDALASFGIEMPLGGLF